MDLKETIILSELNERELLRSLSLRDKDLFNVRVLNSSTLTKEILLRNGIFLEGEVIDIFKQTCIIHELLKDEEYFVSKTLSDSKNIVKAISVARSLCVGDEDIKLNEVLSDGEFKDKNNALLSIYNRYKNYLVLNNLRDQFDEINYCINNKLTIDANFICLDQEELTPLNKKLLEIVSSDKYQTISLLSFAEKENKKLNIISYDNSYGRINEVENILDTIKNKKISLDDVLIVINDDSYLEELINYKELFNVPMTFEEGYPITLSNAYKLYELLRNWDINFNSCAYLLDIFESDAFDENKFFSSISAKELSPKQKKNILKEVGLLRINTGFNKNILDEYKKSLKDNEDYFEIVYSFASELSKGYSYLIKNYTKVREENDFISVLDSSSILKLTKLIDNYLNNLNEANPIDLKEDISALKVLKEFSKPGFIHVTSLKNCLATIRKNIFITGLSASIFPGSPKENYLLLDSDLLRFNEETAPLSNKTISDKKKLLLDVIDIFNGFDSNIYLSYSGYNLSELKEDNPSSMLFEIFKKEKGPSSTVDELNKTIGSQHHYFDSALSNNKHLGQAYLRGKDLLIKDAPISLNEIQKMQYQKEISPSAAEKFFECPRRFYLKYVLGLNEPEQFDLYNILPSNDEGTLIHECMEDYGNNPGWSLDEFMNNASNKFDNYLRKTNPIHKEGITVLKTNYLQMAKEGYNSDPGNIVESSERKLGPIKHESGLIFGGRVDRIEKLDNGKYIIVDYKTYKDFRNKEEDIDTCFQVVLYAYLLSKQDGVEVDRCEYRYLRNPRTVTIHFSEETKKLMDNKIEEISNAFKNGKFDYAKDTEESCKYCPYVSMCGLNALKESEENE